MKSGHPVTAFSIIQNEQAVWAGEKFAGQTREQSALGVAEEAGELCHATLKRSQGLIDEDTFCDKAKDAVGDVAIFLIDYCNLNGWDFQAIVQETWEHVKNRKR